MDTVAMEVLKSDDNNSHTIINLPDEPTDAVVYEKEEVDSSQRGGGLLSRLLGKSESKKDDSFASKKTAAEGMMDIALLTANANQLRFLITYNQESKTFYMSVSLIIMSLVLQVAVGVALIFKRQMKNKGRKNRASGMNDFLVVGVFFVTVINVFAAAFTITHEPRSSIEPSPTL